MKSTLAVSGMTAAASVVGSPAAWGQGVEDAKRKHSAVKHRPLDPVNPDILFGTTSSIYNPQGGHNLEWGVKACSELGLQGIETYADQIDTPQYRNNPKAVQALFDKYNMTYVDCANGAKGMSTNFIDPAQTPKTIADHVAFARDFLQPLGCKQFKCNMGERPPGGPNDAQMKQLVNTLNEIGRQTIAYGVRLAPHPHIWGPLEREKDMRRCYELTDPRYVWMTADLGHLVLGGADPVQVLTDFWPRIAEIHLKDTFARFRGNTQTPTREEHAAHSVYHNLGGGGVDFPAVFKLLRDKHYKGWVMFDVDGPRLGDDGFDSIAGPGSVDLEIDDYMAENINYLRDVIGGSVLN